MSSFSQAEWRYGPLHCTDGSIYIGDPMRSYAAVTSTSIQRLHRGMLQELLPWECINKVHTLFPSTRFRLASRASDVMSVLVAGISGQAETLDSYGPGALRIEAITSSAEWRIDSMETGKYWTPHVEVTGLFIELMRSDASFRRMSASPLDVQQWCKTAVAERR